MVCWRKTILNPTKWLFHAISLVAYSKRIMQIVSIVSRFNRTIYSLARNLKKKTYLLLKKNTKGIFLSSRFAWSTLILYAVAFALILNLNNECTRFGSVEDWMNWHAKISLKTESAESIFCSPFFFICAFVVVVHGSYLPPIVRYFLFLHEFHSKDAHKKDKWVFLRVRTQFRALHKTTFEKGMLT